MSFMYIIIYPEVISIVSLKLFPQNNNLNDNFSIGMGNATQDSGYYINYPGLISYQLNKLNIEN